MAAEDFTFGHMIYNTYIVVNRGSVFELPEAMLKSVHLYMTTANDVVFDENMMKDVRQLYAVSINPDVSFVDYREGKNIYEVEILRNGSRVGQLTDDSRRKLYEYLTNNPDLHVDSDLLKKIHDYRDPTLLQKLGMLFPTSVISWAGPIIGRSGVIWLTSSVVDGVTHGSCYSVSHVLNCGACAGGVVGGFLFGAALSGWCIHNVVVRYRAGELFYDEAVSLICASIGVPVGSVIGMFGGAAAGAFFGPLGIILGAFFGSLAGGFVGHVAGYYAGKLLTEGSPITVTEAYNAIGLSPEDIQSIEIQAADETQGNEAWKRVCSKCKDIYIARALLPGNPGNDIEMGAEERAENEKKFSRTCAAHFRILAHFNRNNWEAHLLGATSLTNVLYEIDGRVYAL